MTCLCMTFSNTRSNSHPHFVTYMLFKVYPIYSYQNGSVSWIIGLCIFLEMTLLQSGYLLNLGHHFLLLWAYFEWRALFCRTIEQKCSLSISFHDRSLSQKYDITSMCSTQGARTISIRTCLDANLLRRMFDRETRWKPHFNCEHHHSRYLLSRSANLEILARFTTLYIED